MKRSIYHPAIIILSVAALFLSCDREFNDNEDYQYNRTEPVLGDNSLLYAKVFRNQSNGTYLWFDLRNEVANFSKPSITISFLRDDNDHYVSIDLRGRIYEYDKEAQVVKFLQIPLDLFGNGAVPVDLLCTLARKDEEADIRSYILVLKQIEVKEINATLSIGEPYTHQNSTVVLTAQSEQQLYLTN